MHAGVRHDLRFQLMELGVQHLMRNALLSQKAGQLFGSLDGNGAHQYGLSLRMSLFHRFHDGVKLFLSRFVYGVLMVDSLHRLVGGDLHHVHAVDIPEFLFLGQRRTGHARFFLKFIEEVLEGDGGKGFTLSLNLHVLLRLNGLMQAVRITPSRHDTARELIHDQHLVILHHIILVAEHQVVGAQRQNDVVLDLQVLRIGQVLNLEELLHLGHTALGQVDHLILFIDDEVPGLLLLHAHDGVQLGKVLHVLAPLHLLGQDVAGLIQSGGLAALSGNDQRGSCFIDQHRVHLIDDGIVQIPQHQLLLIDDHVVSQVIEAQLVIGHIGDVLGVFRAPLLRLHAV